MNKMGAFGRLVNRRMPELTEIAVRANTREDRETSFLTRRIYDALAPFYTVSARLFHSHAHREALAAASIGNGMRVLELAMGSGEMFRRLVEANPDGQSIGVDLSPRMAAHCQDSARRQFPGASAHCHAADARWLPFPTESFDAIICCYLFELLPIGDVPKTLFELRRVLRPGGRLTLTLVAENTPSFNAAYRICSRILPAFWGRQVDRDVIGLLPTCGFVLRTDSYVRQAFYSSHVVSVQACAN
jgi:ubiquinone/menaquinone biosynthesis C-methylase UbiE